MKTFTTTARPMAKAKDDNTTEEPTTRGAQKVDPSVCLGPLGEMTRGAVDINSPAYTGKFK